MIVADLNDLSLVVFKNETSNGYAEIDLKGAKAA